MDQDNQTVELVSLMINNLSESEPVEGVIVDCEKLNLRSEPSFGDNVICEIDKSNRLLIDKSLSTKDFYKVSSAFGIEGFVFKKFVRIEVI